MKRLHVHVSVEDLAQSIRFYATLFAAEPSVVKPDYAKWMLDDPRVNFAISARGGGSGIRHLGIQAEDAAELAEVYGRLAAAERPVVEQRGIACCYARSDKQWIADPQGVAWETFLTHGEATVYGTGGAPADLREAGAAACCEPALAAAPGACCAGQAMAETSCSVPVLCTGNAARGIPAEAPVEHRGRGGIAGLREVR